MANLMVKDNSREVVNILDKKLREALIRALTKSAFLVEGTAKELAPFGKTGQLGASIHNFVNEQELNAVIYTELEYSPYVEYSTRAHIIKPKDKKALAWGANLGTLPNGDTKRSHLAKMVRHPGSSEQPFMRPALDNNVENIKKIFASEINSIKT